MYNGRRGGFKSGISRPKMQYSRRPTGANRFKDHSAILKRDSYKCRRCGTSVRGKSYHIHHIRKLGASGTDHISNKVTLCEDCHHNRLHSHKF